MDPLFNPANEKMILPSGDLWVVTNNGVVAYVTANAEDAARVIGRALSVSTQPGHTRGVIACYFAKKNLNFPLVVPVVGSRFDAV